MLEIALQLKTKALLLVPLCEGNQIAAAILDWVLTYSLIYARVNDIEPYQIYVESAYGYLCNPGPFQELGYSVDPDGQLLVSMNELRTVVSSQLASTQEISDHAIFEAIDLLQTKWFVRAHTLDWGEKEQDPLFYISPIFPDRFDAACVAWVTGKPQAVPPAPSLDKRREQRIVRAQCGRASRIGQAATLTLDEWIETLTYFQGRCAFNAEHAYTVLEHFIPIVQGGVQPQ